jgi:uncharacterized protein (TIRG00374 family)
MPWGYLHVSKPWEVNLDFGLATAFGFSSVLFGAASFIPGGLVVTEISFIKFLSNSGFTIATATALIILIRLSSVWYSTLIGAIATYFASKLRQEQYLQK